MSEAIEIVRRSANLTRVLSDPSQDQQFSTILPVTDQPDSNLGTITPGYNGVWDAGHGGAVAPQAVYFQPFGIGQPGQQFSMRVFGWRHAKPIGNVQGVWVPEFYAEMLCTLSAVGGITGMALDSNEYLCDTIVLSQGSLGPAASELAEITVAGSGLVGGFTCELRGCRKFMATFCQVDPVLMNAFWAPKS